jgi:predicted dehydrogenase
LAVPTLRLKIYTNRTERSWYNPFHSETIAIEHTDPLKRQLENFCAVIRGEAEPVVTGREGLKNLRAIDAIMRAAHSETAILLT